MNPQSKCHIKNCMAIVVGLRKRAEFLRSIQSAREIHMLGESEVLSRYCSRTLAAKLERAFHSAVSARCEHSDRDWWASDRNLACSETSLRSAEQANGCRPWGLHEYTTKELADIGKAYAEVAGIKASRKKMSWSYRVARKQLWPAFREEQARSLGLQAEGLLQVPVPVIIF